MENFFTPTFASLSSPTFGALTSPISPSLYQPSFIPIDQKALTGEILTPVEGISPNFGIQGMMTGMPNMMTGMPNLSYNFPQQIGDINSPYVSSLNLSYSKPYLGIYKNLNLDPNVHDMVVNYVYYKMMEKWLKGDLSPLLNYLTVSGGKVIPIHNISIYNPNARNSEQEMALKLGYIGENILLKSEIEQAIENLRSETGINWYDIPHRDFIVKKAMENYLRRRFLKLIK